MGSFLRSSPAAPLIVLIAFGTACGARSELIVGPPDASSTTTSDASRDVPFVPPDCGTSIAPGTVRYTLDGVVGRGAADPNGNVYVPVVVGDAGRAVRSVDPCGQLRWQTTAWEGDGHRLGDVRFATSSEVLLTDVGTPNGWEPIARFDTDGRLVGRIQTETAGVRTIALPDGAGPIVATVGATNLVSQIERFDREGTLLERIGDWSNANECVASSQLIACLDRAWEIPSHRLLWSRSFEILDGTLRHVVAQAFVGGDLYSFYFGISSFVLERRDARSGTSRFRTLVERSSTGQSNMLAAGPVVRDDGEIFVYLRTGGASGSVREFSPDGSLVRSFSAAAATELFDDAGSLALGRDGTLYLAVGRTVYALDRDLRVRWTLMTEERVDRAWSMITPAGDLLVHTESDRVLAIATDSPGASGGGWPMARGDARNAYAR